VTAAAGPRRCSNWSASARRPAEQLGTPADVYLRPATAFLADFVGLSNRLPGRLDGDGVVLGTRLPTVSPAGRGPDVTALVRQESIEVVPDATT
jgi:putative spermidine/putrescine transport system ATP-binding protein